METEHGFFGLAGIAFFTILYLILALSEAMPFSAFITWAAGLLGTGVVAWGGPIAKKSWVVWTYGRVKGKRDVEGFGLLENMEEEEVRSPVLNTDEFPSPPLNQEESPG